MVDLSQLSNVLDSSSWQLFLLWSQWDSSHSSTLELKAEDLVREKYEKRADLRVEHGLHWYMAWHGVTLEKKWNRIWNQHLSKNKSLDCLSLPVVSVANAPWSLPCYQILNEVSDLRREKSHYYLENGYRFVLQFYFWCSYDNFSCYESPFKRFTAGAEHFPSGILREWVSVFPK